MFKKDDVLYYLTNELNIYNVVFEVDIRGHLEAVVLHEGCRKIVNKGCLFRTKQEAIDTAETLYAERKAKFEKNTANRQKALDRCKANLEKLHAAP